LRKEHGKEVSLAKIVDDCARHDIRALSPWRDPVQAVGSAEASRPVRANDTAPGAIVAAASAAAGDLLGIVGIGSVDSRFSSAASLAPSAAGAGD
jgi:hypothetical protein